MRIGDQLRLTKESRAVYDGSQFDDNARGIEFERPENRDGHNLILYFADTRQTFSPISLGIGNAFVIPNTLTQTTALELQVAFEALGVYSERSDIFKFRLRPSLENTRPVADWPPEGWFLPDPDVPGIPGPPGQQGPPGRDGADGQTGPPGADGADGLTPFIGLNGHWWIGDHDTGVIAEGTQGIQGPPGQPGSNGADGQPGQPGATGATGANGANGKSAYEIWLDAGHVGNEQAFFDFITGPQGPPGTAGLTMEYGNWTPFMAAGGLTLYSVRIAKYIKFGRLVFIWFNFEIEPAGGDPQNTDSTKIGGLPYTVNYEYGGFSGPFLVYANATSTTGLGVLTAIPDHSATTFRLGFLAANAVNGLTVTNHRTGRVSYSSFFAYPTAA